ncbi:MAG: hypothetical protein R2684_15595 [Pyrinomonadaceae bacterium]
MISEKTNSVPLWIVLVSLAYALLTLVGVATLVFSPERVLEGVDVKAKGILFLTNIWATRNLAVGAVLAYSALKRSAPMLLLSYVFLLVTLIGDVVNGIVQNEQTFAISSGIVAVLAMLVAFLIRRRMD